MTKVFNVQFVSVFDQDQMYGQIPAEQISLENLRLRDGISLYFIIELAVSQQRFTVSLLAMNAHATVDERWELDEIISSDHLNGQIAITYNILLHSQNPIELLCNGLEEALVMSLKTLTLSFQAERQELDIIVDLGTRSRTFGTTIYVGGLYDQFFEFIP